MKIINFKISEILKNLFKKFPKKISYTFKIYYTGYDVNKDKSKTNKEK